MGLWPSTREVSLASLLRLLVLLPVPGLFFKRARVWKDDGCQGLHGLFDILYDKSNYHEPSVGPFIVTA